MYNSCIELLKRLVNIMTIFIIVILSYKNENDFALKVSVSSLLLSHHELSLITCHNKPVDSKAILKEELDNMNNRLTPYPNTNPTEIVIISAVNSNASKQKQQFSQTIDQHTIHSDSLVPIKPTKQVSNTQKPASHVSQTPSITLTTKPIRERATRFASLDVPSFSEVPDEKMPRVIKELWKDSEKIDYIHDFLFEFAYPKTHYKGKTGYTYYSLSEAIAKYQVTNSILLMLTDLGYLEQFWNTYLYGNFTQYKNLVVACINQEAYEVFFHSRVYSFIDSY